MGLLREAETGSADSVKNGQPSELNKCNFNVVEWRLW